MAIKLYDKLPKLRLVLHSNYVPSVNEMYDYCVAKNGVRVYKPGPVVDFQTEIGTQVIDALRNIDRSWLNNNNYYVTDYKFCVRNSYDSRDVTNMVKIIEDAIHRAFGQEGPDDARVIRSTCQKFHNPELIQEVIIFTITPYVGSTSIFKATDNDMSDQDEVTKSNTRLQEYYQDKVKTVVEELGYSFPLSVNARGNLNIGYIAINELNKICEIKDLTLFLRTAHYLGYDLTVVQSKRSQWIKMISPTGEVCEMYDEEIRDRLNDGYAFNEQNYFYSYDTI